jgi:hypothetical protein
MHHGSGYGYQVRLVDDLDNIDQDLAISMEWALDEIHKIQKAARTGKPIVKPLWPVLILHTPKVPSHFSLFCEATLDTYDNNNRDGVHPSHSTIRLLKALSMRIKSLSLHLRVTQSSLPCFPRGSHHTNPLSYLTKMDPL